MTGDLGETSRLRAAARRWLRREGPTAGRLVDHLKLASAGSAAERLLDLYEQGAVPARATCELTRRVGLGGQMVFLLDLGVLDGRDGLE